MSASGVSLALPFLEKKDDILTESLLLGSAGRSRECGEKGKGSVKHCIEWYCANRCKQLQGNYVLLRRGYISKQYECNACDQIIGIISNPCSSMLDCAVSNFVPDAVRFTGGSITIARAAVTGGAT